MIHGESSGAAVELAGIPAGDPEAFSVDHGGVARAACVIQLQRRVHDVMTIGDDVGHWHTPVDPMLDSDVRIELDHGRTAEAVVPHPQPFKAEVLLGMRIDLVDEVEDRVVDGRVRV